MVNLAAMVWRRLLRKRWVLALVFGLSLVYFLTSTFKQVSDRSPSRACSGQRSRPPGFPPPRRRCACSRAARVSGEVAFLSGDGGRAEGPARVVAPWERRRC